MSVCEFRHNGRRVVATHHAVRRATARIAHLERSGLDEARAWVVETAADGLGSGLSARRFPRWGVRLWQGYVHRPGFRQKERMRYVWDLEETAIMVVQQTAKSDSPVGESVYLVITVMTPRTNEW